MDKFAYYIKHELERHGYQAEAIGEKPAAITMEFKGVGAIGFADRFAVVYLRQMPTEAAPELIRSVFDYHKMPVLFVVNESLVIAHQLEYTTLSKAPPLWLRALHAIYYGRIYTWMPAHRVIQALHFDWDNKRAWYSEAIEIDRVILTETDSLLRDYPGHFKIARFSDRAFWKGERPQKPPKRDSKKSTPNENFWQQEFWKHQYETPPKQERPETIYEMFERLKREEMRRRQAQQQHTYNQRPNRYNPPSGDEWFTRLMGDGDLEGAQKIYRELAKQYHPDVNREPGALEIMQKINAAYDRVKDILV